MTTVIDFNRAVREFAKDKVPAELVKLHKIIVLDALGRVTLKMPVDTGRARGNTQVGIGSPPTGETGRNDPSGAETQAAGAAVVADLQAYEAAYVTNNVPYIEALENGHSGQAPQGMFAVTLEELQQRFL